MSSEKEKRQSGNLRKVYARYRRFMDDIARRRRRRTDNLTYDTFVQQWATLTPDQQRHWADYFRKGYTRVVKEAHKEVAKVIAAHKKRRSAGK